MYRGICKGMYRECIRECIGINKIDAVIKEVDEMKEEIKLLRK